MNVNSVESGTAPQLLRKGECGERYGTFETFEGTVGWEGTHTGFLFVFVVVIICRLQYGKDWN